MAEVPSSHGTSALVASPSGLLAGVVVVAPRTAVARGTTVDATSAASVVATVVATMVAGATPAGEAVTPALAAATVAAAAVVDATSTGEVATPALAAGTETAAVVGATPAGEAATPALAAARVAASAVVGATSTGDAATPALVAVTVAAAVVGATPAGEAATPALAAARVVAAVVVGATPAGEAATPALAAVTVAAAVVVVGGTVVVVGGISAGEVAAPALAAVTVAVEVVGGATPAGEAATPALAAVAVTVVDAAVVATDCGCGARSDDVYECAGVAHDSTSWSAVQRRQGNKATGVRHEVEARGGYAGGERATHRHPELGVNPQNLPPQSQAAHSHVHTQPQPQPQPHTRPASVECRPHTRAHCPTSNVSHLSNAVCSAAASTPSLCSRLPPVTVTLHMTSHTRRSEPRLQQCMRRSEQSIRRAGAKHLHTDGYTAMESHAQPHAHSHPE